MKYIVSINGKNYEVEVEKGRANIIKTTETVVVPAQVPEPPAPVPSVAVPILLFQQHLITLEVSPQIPPGYNPRN